MYQRVMKNQKSVIKKTTMTVIMSLIKPYQQTKTFLFLLHPQRKARNVNGILKTGREILQKKMRSCGEAYQTHSKNKKMRQKRQVRYPCKDCKLKCPSKFTEEEGIQIFLSYWSLGEFQKQREYINKLLVAVVPQYRYIRVGGTRKPRDKNNAYYFVKEGK
ncbi:uncharacterized protein LOC126889842 [Diabrotica virgifera virgifera]|uniref:Uncharacterized protein n=1 Tax=Diabrotica virgifera virgifera TaxID=50390 RepID=A0ABM5KWB8_DIAVI|nr:uncharacterized protein LOC126889842 [Diabrotica virgifera virgifera]